MRITKLNDNHLDKIVKINDICFNSQRNEYIIIEELNNSNYTVLGCFFEEELCGYLSYSNICGEIEICKIAVLPKFRKKGIATELLEKMLSDNYSKVFLEVRKSNIPAINLYKKLGFKEINRRKNYYSNPTEDAIIMTKEEINENFSN